MSARPWPDALPDDARRRAGGVVLVLLLHAALGLMFLTIAPRVSGSKKPETAMISLSIPDSKPEAEPQPAPKAAEAARPAPVKRPPVPAPPLPKPPVVIPLELPSTALAPPLPAPPLPAPPLPAPPDPPAPQKPLYGPPDLRPKGPPDSERVEGSGPNGEPLYAARWVREPYHDELAGYLSTAQGPGWGLIACRTVENFRVEDCVFVDEYPRGSNIARSVLAAAWQFRVHPPQIGGRPQVGSWVRIRITYENRPTRNGQ